VTNASTTSLLEVSTRTWATEIMAKAGLRKSLFPPLRQPGDPIGPLRPGLRITAADGTPLPLLSVGSHDTASAVAAVPADGPAFAYISSGTWSLVGMELPAPVLTEASREANFTNEAGVDGTVRYLRNVSGLWLLQECLRDWGSPPLQPLLTAAARETPLRFVVDADDPAFLSPGEMPSRIAAWLGSRGRPAPASRVETVRCVLDSLALAYARAVSAAQRLSGRHADVVHIVGGGARNALLCQLAADACGLPVVAGPAEATALGNVLIQARALGAAPGSLPELRGLVRSWLSAGSGGALQEFTPSGARESWAAAARRIGP
jgi:rhamnulokinase